MAGFGIGLSVGMLAAPRAGSATRKAISDTVHNGIDEAKRKGAELRTAAESSYENGRRAVESQARGVREAVEAGKRAYRETASA